jgi:hypothetical protein
METTRFAGASVPEMIDAVRPPDLRGSTPVA